MKQNQTSNNCAVLATNPHEIIIRSNMNAVSGEHEINQNQTLKVRSNVKAGSGLHGATGNNHNQTLKA